MTDTMIISKVGDCREDCNLSDKDVVLNLQNMIVNIGYFYKEEYFNDDFDACSQYLNGERVIFYNMSHQYGKNFKNFTLAHELGHWYLHFDFLCSNKMHRSTFSYQSDNSMEREADKFAINYLAPKRQFLENAQFKSFNPETIFELSNVFGISYYAAALRFIELTDLVCSLIVCDTNSTVHYERRSPKLFEYINNKSSVTTAEISLSDWYPDLEYNIPATESILSLEYNNQFLVFIEPKVNNLQEFLENQE